MFGRKPGVTLETVELNLRPVPEVDSSQISQLVALSSLCHTLGGLSFGGFVMRKASDLHIAELQHDIAHTGVAYDDVDTDNEIGLHVGKAELNGLCGRLAITEALRSWTEVMIFDWPEFCDVKPTLTRNLGNLETLTPSLVKAGVMHTVPGAYPKHVFHTQLGPGDVLVFDQTQPHLMYPLAPDCRATTHFPSSPRMLSIFG